MAYKSTGINKLMTHPDREEIIKKLLAAESPNKVSDWLTEKYPEQRKLRVDHVTLASFRKNYLNLDREAVRLLKMERQKKEMGIPYNKNATAFINKKDEDKEKYALRVKETLLQSPSYAEKLKSITEATLDGPRLIKELVALLQSRVEVYFNAVASGSSVGESLKADKQFAEYVSLMKDLIKDSKKIEDDYNTQPDEGTVELNVVHEQVGLIRETVKELLNEFSPELALEFMDKLNKKMTLLEYQPAKAPDMLQRVEKLNKRIKEIQDAGIK